MPDALPAPDRPSARAAQPADATRADDASAAHAAPHAPLLDLSDTPAHARHPEDYTETPGSHRRTPDGPALDVGG